MFWGTPSVASETLQNFKRKWIFAIAYCHFSDAKSGRGLLLQASPVKIWAEKNNIPYIQPEKPGELEILFTAFRRLTSREKQSASRRICVKVKSIPSPTYSSSSLMENNSGKYFKSAKMGLDKYSLFPLAKIPRRFAGGIGYLKRAKRKPG